MQNDLLEKALLQVQNCDAPLRAAGLLRITRALVLRDPSRARALLTDCLAHIRELSDSDQQSLLDEAREVAAAVDPEQLAQIPSSRFGRSRDHFEAGQIIQSMLAFGHVDAAFEFLMNMEEPSAFPFVWLGNVLHHLQERRPGEVSRRLLLLRRAVEMWQRGPSGPFHHERDHFIRLFGIFWKEFPEEEALAISRMIVDQSTAEADLGISAGYMYGVQFTSRRQNALFQVLHTLRHLDPPLAQTLVEAHEQLAIAAQRYPNGLETMHAEAEAESQKRQREGATCQGGGFIFAGDPADFDRQRRLFEASRSGDFAAAIEDVQERYREDTSPAGRNYAPKAYWPSTGALRRLVYDAGKRLGRDASALLPQAPDEDLRLFATIELAAALDGAPPSSIRQIKQPNPPHLGTAGQRRTPSSRTPLQGRLGSTPMRSPDGRLIRCPQCAFQPRDDLRWTCTCGHLWNTFWTSGNCPACHHQWQETQCPNCGQKSEHKRWYVAEP